MLIGEPGVGKTAIVEGLAHRLEFEQETVPPRLRDCQVISLQMNTIVAGTMSRGMFAHRMQNVIREIKERSNLILFVDEAHYDRCRIGAGCACRRGKRLRVRRGSNVTAGCIDRHFRSIRRYPPAMSADTSARTRGKRSPPGHAR